MFRLFPEEDLRASDADREETVEFLKRHYADGRLNSAELSTRVDAAYAAVGLSELDVLTRDLPPLAPVPTGERPVEPRWRGGRVLAASLALLGFLAIAAALPPELWAMLLFLGLPVVMMLLFGLLPFALPVLAVAWLVRSLAARPVEQPRRLGSGSARVSTWYVGDLTSRRRPPGHGRPAPRRRGWLDL